MFRKFASHKRYLNKTIEGQLIKPQQKNSTEGIRTVEKEVKATLPKKNEW